MSVGQNSGQTNIAITAIELARVKIQFRLAMDCQYHWKSLQQILCIGFKISFITDNAENPHTNLSASSVCLALLTSLN